MMLASFATMCGALALVIWIKLRVVSTIPRQALAEPETAQPLAPPRDDARPREPRITAPADAPR